MWLRACAKCNGDVYLREIDEDEELVCMQCGFIATPAAARKLLGRRRQAKASKPDIRALERR